MNDTRGSLWRKWDLHVHTPASFHWEGKRFAEMTSEEETASLAEIVKKMTESGIPAFGIMDYWTFDGYLKLRRYISTLETPPPFVVFPGMELRIEAPVDFRLNIQIVLSDALDDQDFIDFKGALKINGKVLSDAALIAAAKQLDPSKAGKHGFFGDDLKDESKLLLLGSQTVQVSRESLTEAMSRLPGKALIILPYDTSDGLAKLDWEAHPHDDNYFMRSAHFFETRSPDNVDLFLGRKTPKNSKFIANFQKTMGRSAKPVISGSDAHRMDKYGAFYGDRITWLKADVSFEGLLQVVNEPGERCYIGNVPPKLEQVAAHKTKFIKAILLKKVAGSRLEETWFDSEILLNPDLIAIIGNKGQGKSALAESIGLAGNSRHQEHFSFLSPKNFCNPRNLKASHYEASILWESGSKETIRLDGKGDVRKPETVKFIPQNFLESICTQIGQPDETDFDKELRKVIFSHVDEIDRLGKASLEELLAHKTEEANSRMAQIKTAIVELNAVIRGFESRLESEYLQTLQNSLARKQEELAVHKGTPITEVAKPELDPQTQLAISKVTEEIEAKKLLRSTLEAEISTLRQVQQRLAIKITTVDKALAKLSNLERSFVEYESQLKEELFDLGIPFSSLAKLIVDRKPLEDKKAAFLTEKSATDSKLNSDTEGNLISQMAAANSAILEFQNALDTPNKTYQAYLAAREIWTKAEAGILGSATTEGSLKFFEAAIADLENVPGQLEKLEKERFSKTIEIYREIAGLAKAYRDLYAPVQKFIAGREVTREKFNLNFSVSIVDSGFGEQFFDFISHAISGSFCGVEEGKQRLNRILSRNDFNTEEGVSAFLTEIMDALSKDHRLETPSHVKRDSQLRKGHTLEKLYDFIFCLDYLAPRYGLKMGEKELYQLSPGERGTLLLVFYLMVDKGDTPLVIDQPEENLDNQTVFELLVPCIKDAKIRRQIIIVTHNPNLAVVCDAEQVIQAKLDKKDGYKVEYLAGAIENSTVNKAIVDVLEGTRPAFDNRDAKYLWKS